MEYIETTKKCHFRSRLNELPLQLRTDIALVTLQDGWNNVKRRQEMKKLVGDYPDVDLIDVGTGTNRFIMKYDGYALKIALDDEGINDNKQEWIVGPELPRLNPKISDVALPYDVSKGGHLLVADYVPAFTSSHEMYDYQDKIRMKLANWFRHGYLLGDVGCVSKNFANWGLLNGEPMCIDYAYIFKASATIFGCDRCGCKELVMDTNYANYKCPKCNREFPDAFLRSRISGNIRAKHFQESLENTIEMTSPSVDMECTVKEKVRYNPDAPNSTENLQAALQMVNNKSFGR